MGSTPAVTAPGEPCQNTTGLWAIRGLNSPVPRWSVVVIGTAPVSGCQLLQALAENVRRTVRTCPTPFSIAALDGSAGHHRPGGEPLHARPGGLGAGVSIPGATTGSANQMCLRDRQRFSGRGLPSPRSPLTGHHAAQLTAPVPNSWDGSPRVLAPAERTGESVRRLRDFNGRKRPVQKPVAGSALRRAPVNSLQYHHQRGQRRGTPTSRRIRSMCLFAVFASH